MKLKLISVFISMIIILSVFDSIQAAPYQNYTYNERGAGAEPQAYRYAGLISGKTLGIDSFLNPQDIYAADDGLIYIADSGNNRIVIIDSNFKLVKIINEFINKTKKDTFNNPQGIFVSQDNIIYIADTDNSRIVILDKDGGLKAEYGRPETDLFTATQLYKPIKIATDIQQRIYIVAAGLTSGMIELGKDGSFTGFYGAIPVTKTLSSFQKLFLNKEKRIRSAQNIPTVYTNLDVDKKGFIFGTVNLVGGAVNPVSKLNPMGRDILRRYGITTPCGDPSYYLGWNTNTNKLDTSNLIDVCTKDYGIYSVLDLLFGRIFTYDYDGNLLYTFGSLGEQTGSFGLPSAVDSIEGDRFLVVDTKLNQIVVFEPTNYGNLITQAAQLQFQRKYIEAEKKWTEVLKYTSKSVTAYNGLGRAMLRQKNYSQAMKYFEIGDARSYYSIAFTYYRQEFMSKYFGIFLAIAFAVIILMFIISKIHKSRKKRGDKNGHQG